MSEYLDIVLKHLISSANESGRLEPIQPGRSFIYCTLQIIVVPEYCPVGLQMQLAGGQTIDY